MSEHQQQQRQVIEPGFSPIHYLVDVQPNLETFTFEGVVTVQLHCDCESSRIHFNANELEIKNVDVCTLQGEDQQKVPVGQALPFSYRQEDQSVFVNLPKSIAAGERLEMVVQYSGILNDKMNGFYRSTYRDVDGQEKVMACTQFEVSDARKALPCWDEPEKKAIFSVILRVPRHLTAVSNMPIIAEEVLEGDLKKVTFDKTPIMSTYLLAFVVGEMEYVEDVTSEGTLVRVYAPAGKKEHGRFALKVARDCLPFFTEYFGIAYPLPKVDLLAIPDFAAGAMENWGCITYRETALLVDPDNSSAIHTTWVSLVVCHELAHQWFGNLVTMRWWDDLWLNEGFATWVEYLATDHLFPEWNVWNQFVTMDMASAFSLDSLENSHPIQQTVNTTAEADEMFDSISYSKGCALIRQLAEFLGLEKFRNGLRIYLKRFEYSNAETTDLWTALSESSGMDVNALMTSWTKQTGYPVVQVKETTWSPEKAVLTLSQERYLPSARGNPPAQTWMVPITYLTSKGVFGTLTFDSAEGTLEVADPRDWIKFNPGMTGFYLVNYSEERWIALKSGIEQGAFSELDRLGLQNNILCLAQCKYVSTGLALKFVEVYREEDSFTVWTDLLSNLADFKWLLSNNEQLLEKYKNFERTLLTHACEKLGWDPVPGELHGNATLRPMLLRRLGSAGEQQILDQAMDRFQSHLSGDKAIHADLRAAVFAMALSEGGRDALDALLKIYRNADASEEKNRVLRSLGSISDPAVLEDALSFVMGSEVKSQDCVPALGSVCANPKHIGRVWQLFKDQFQVFQDRYGGGGFLLPRMIKCFENFYTEEMASEVESFFAEHPIPVAARAVKQVLERIRFNAFWASSAIAEVAEALSQY